MSYTGNKDANCASQKSEIISYHDTNQYFGIAMYTINKVKGLLFWLP